MISAQEIKHEWITPVDENARLRPECEVRQVETEPWATGYVLIGVLDHGIPIYLAKNDKYFGTWLFCRVRNTEVQPHRFYVEKV